VFVGVLVVVVEVVVVVVLTFSILLYRCMSARLHRGVRGGGGGVGVNTYSEASS
jgi:preprotein translocase subunit SecG